MRINNENLLENAGVVAPVSLATSANLKPVYLGHVNNYAVQLTYTGTPAGNFKLQGSCDPGSPNATSEAQQSAGVVNWSDIGSSQITISAAGNTLYNVIDAAYTWVRVVWTATGAGTTPVLTVARINVKGV